MLFQVAANQLLVLKKTWPSLFMLVGGAAFNIALNLVLIPVLGIEGAAVATLAGYLLTNAIALIVLMRMGQLKMGSRFYISTVIFLAFFLVWRFGLYDLTLVLLILWAVLCLVYGWLYKPEIFKVVTKVKRSLKKV